MRQIVFAFVVALTLALGLAAVPAMMSIVLALVLYCTWGEERTRTSGTASHGSDRRKGEQVGHDRSHLDPLRSRQTLLVHRQGRRGDSVGAVMTELTSQTRFEISRRAHRVGLWERRPSLSSGGRHATSRGRARHRWRDAAVTRRLGARKKDDIRRGAN